MTHFASSHLIDTCAFASGRLEQIKPSHSASPPYPLGQEIPPEGCEYFCLLVLVSMQSLNLILFLSIYADVNPIDGTRSWPVSDLSAPHLCTVDPYNLRILSVFHYGLQEELDEPLATDTHYYPPHKIEGTKIHPE